MPQYVYLTNWTNVPDTKVSEIFLDTLTNLINSLGLNADSGTVDPTKITYTPDFSKALTDMMLLVEK
jgi:hypothetical protein